MKVILTGTRCTILVKLLPADNATGNFTKIVQRVPVKITFKPEDLKAYEGRLVPGMSAIAEVSIKSNAK